LRSLWCWWPPASFSSTGRNDRPSGASSKMANGPGHLRTVNVDEAVQQAVFALNNKCPDEAERIAGEALKRDPRHAGALHVVGCALLMQGRTQEAIAPLEAAARAQHNPEIDLKLATALRNSGRVDDAVSRLKRATKRQPPFVPAFHELGCLLVVLERYDEAIEVFRHGLEVAPMTMQLSLQLGGVFMQCRKWADAKVTFAQTLSIAPNSPEALFGMAKAHQELGEYRAAAECYRRCLRVKPDPLIWHNLGRCLLMTGENKEGYDCLRWAVRGDPKRYGGVLGTLVKSPHGRFFLRPSAAARFIREAKS
jgi:tetratricopeptide (TPR) repeat protein